MTPPQVAVILPIYNRAHLIGRALDSVLAQTFTDIEIVVVDDGSTDDLERALKPYGDRITVLRQDQRGPYAARNLGIRSTTGEFIAFIDSDDRWLPDRLERQLAVMRRPQVGLVFANAQIAGSRRTTFDITPPARGAVARHFLWGNFVSTSTVLVRRAALGEFCEDSRLSSDYLAWFRVAHAWELDYVDDVLAEYTVHPGGISFDLGRSLEARIDLFTRELARTDDPDVRATLDRLVFHLGLHLAAACARGRSNNYRLARETLARTRPRHTAQWLPPFVAHHVISRSRRVMS